MSIIPTLCAASRIYHYITPIVLAKFPGLLPTTMPPLKKRKLVPILEKIHSLEADIGSSLAQGGSLNGLADLLDLARSASDPAILHKALYALYRACVSIAASPKLNLSKCPTEETRLVRTWLLERLGEYTDLLCDLMADEDRALRVSTFTQLPASLDNYFDQCHPSIGQTAALQILMSMLKHLSTAFSIASNTPQIYSVLFRKIVGALAGEPPSGQKVYPDVRDAFLDTWLASFDDIRWFFLRGAT